MTSPPEFTLNVGTLISKSFGIYFKNFIPFVFLSALIMSPWIALRYLLALDPTNVGLSLTATLVSVLMIYVLTGTLTYGVVQQMRGTPAGIGDAISRGMQALPRALGTGLLVGLRTLLFTLLLIVPGIMESVRLYVAIPAAVMEGNGGDTAVQRSIKLTDGSRWPIFGSFFIMALIGFVPLFVIMFVMITVSGGGEMPWWFEVGISLMIQPISAVAMAVCYFLLRQGKEQVSVEDIAAVFD